VSNRLVLRLVPRSVMSLGDKHHGRILNATPLVELDPPGLARFESARGVELGFAQISGPIWGLEFPLTTRRKSDVAPWAVLLSNIGKVAVFSPRKLFFELERMHIGHEELLLVIVDIAIKVSTLSLLPRSGTHRDLHGKTSFEPVHDKLYASRQLYINAIPLATITDTLRILVVLRANQLVGKLRAKVLQNLNTVPSNFASQGPDNERIVFEEGASDCQPP